MACFYRAWQQCLPCSSNFSVTLHTEILSIETSNFLKQLYLSFHSMLNVLCSLHNHDNNELVCKFYLILRTITCCSWLKFLKQVIILKSFQLVLNVLCSLHCHDSNELVCKFYQILRTITCCSWLKLIVLLLTRRKRDHGYCFFSLQCSASDKKGLWG